MLYIHTWRVLTALRILKLVSLRVLVQLSQIGAWRGSQSTVRDRLFLLIVLILTFYQHVLKLGANEASAQGLQISL